MIARQKIASRFAAKAVPSVLDRNSKLKPTRLQMKTVRLFQSFASIALTRGFTAFFLIALATLCPNLGHAQAITPVWEYLLNKPSPLPILTNYVAWPDDEENGDGK